MALSGVSYSGGASGLVIETWEGTIPGLRFRTMSSNPFVVQPAAYFSLQSTYFIIGAEFYGGYASAGAGSPYGLTFDLSIYPFFEFDWRSPGQALISCATSPPLSFGALNFWENSLNGTPFANLTIKNQFDAPGTDYFECKYRILYIKQDKLQ